MARDESIVSDVSCWVVAALFVVGLVTLGVNLKEVQVDGAADYSYASARQSMRRVQTAGPRGRILDRRGTVLAGNRRSISVACLPSCFQRRTWEGTAEAISNAIARAAEVTGARPGVSWRTVRRHVSQSLAMPLCVWRDVGPEVLARFAERERELVGFEIVESQERTYPLGAAAAHVVGYVGRDRGESAAGDEKVSFYQPEMRGRSGLEAYYDAFLRGVPGENRLLVDARGFAIGTEVVSEARTGPDLELSIDAAVQDEAYACLAGTCGACAVVNPANGEVLALASSPAYDSNAFVPFLSQEVYDSYAKDARKPLLNRACGGAYAPGSTFKPVVALAGLDMGFPPEEEYACTGVFEVGEMCIKCARRWGHGPIDMRTAIRDSCNPYFCNLGMDVGTNAVLNAARALGLGSKTGLDLGVDMAGVVPDAEWKMRMYSERWFQGDLAQMSIGQGMLLASPLQMALVAGAIGTGQLVTPHLKRDLPAVRRPLPFSAEHLQVVRDGMRKVVDGGTGRLGGEGVPVSVSGKTGTAEVGMGAMRRKNTWFIAYAPAESPTVAVAVVVENGESGGTTAAPRAAAVLRRAFRGVSDAR